MKSPIRYPQADCSALATEQGRQLAVRFALRLTENSPLAPKQYERLLLEQFVHGELSLDQVIAQLEAPE